MRSSAARLVAAVFLSAFAASLRGATQSPTEPNETPDSTALLSRITSSIDRTDHVAYSAAQGTAKELWQGRVSAPGPEQDVQTQSALAELIEKVRSVRFEPKEPPPSASPPAVPKSPRPRADGASAAANGASQPIGPAPTPSPKPPTALAPEVMGVLQHLLAEPNQVSDPLPLAELLFLSDHLTEAAVFYQKALDRATAALPAGREDRAWILLQLGNCLQETDPTQAQNMYAKVMTEHADSPWAELAKAQSQLLAWYERIQPRQWITPVEARPAEPGVAQTPPQP